MIKVVHWNFSLEKINVDIFVCIYVHIYIMMTPYYDTKQWGICEFYIPNTLIFFEKFLQYVVSLFLFWFLFL